MAATFSRPKLNETPEKKAHRLDMLNADKGVTTKHEGWISKRRKRIGLALVSFDPRCHPTRVQVGKKAAWLKTNASRYVSKHGGVPNIALAFESSSKHSRMVRLEHSSFAR